MCVEQFCTLQCVFLLEKIHGEYFFMVHAIQISIDEVMYVQCIQRTCTYVNESKSYTQLFVEFLCVCIKDTLSY
jgi:hypothetical protein